MKNYIYGLIIFVCLCGLLHVVLTDKTMNIDIKNTASNIEKVDFYIDQIIDDNKKFLDKSDIKQFSWDVELLASNWNYYDGILMLALIKHGKYKDFADDFYNAMIKDDGSLNNVRNKHNVISEYDVDFFPQVRTLLYLEDFSKYKLMLDGMYDKLKIHPVISQCGNNLYHQALNPGWQRYPLALDGIYMAQPFVLEYEKEANRLGLKHKNNDSKNIVFNRLNWVHNNMANKLDFYDHVVSNDGKETNHVSWLRAIGWYAMAQVDILDSLPEGENKEVMKIQLKNFFDPMIKKQSKTNGMWKNVVYSHTGKEFMNIFEMGHNCNYYETSGSAMMAYALMKSYNEGYLTDKKYAYAGLKAFNGIVSNNLKQTDKHRYSLSNIYRSTGASSQISYYKSCRGYLFDEAKGVAPLILANVEAKKLLKILYNSEK